MPLTPEQEAIDLSTPSDRLGALATPEEIEGLRVVTARILAKPCKAI